MSSELQPNRFTISVGGYLNGSPSSFVCVCVCVCVCAGRGSWRVVLTHGYV